MSKILEQSPIQELPIKCRRGRPIGSKNKPKNILPRDLQEKQDWIPTEAEELKSLFAEDYIQYIVKNRIRLYIKSGLDINGQVLERILYLALHPIANKKVLNVHNPKGKGSHGDVDIDVKTRCLTRLKLGSKGGKSKIAKRTENIQFKLSLCRTTKVPTVSDKIKVLHEKFNNCPYECIAITIDYGDKIRVVCFIIDKTKTPEMIINESNNNDVILSNDKKIKTCYDCDYALTKQTGDQWWFSCSDLEGFIKRNALVLLYDERYNIDQGEEHIEDILKEIKNDYKKECNQ